MDLQDEPSAAQFNLPVIMSEADFNLLRRPGSHLLVFAMVKKPDNQNETAALVGALESFRFPEAGLVSIDGQTHKMEAAHLYVAAFEHSTKSLTSELSGRPDLADWNPETALRDYLKWVVTYCVDNSAELIELMAPSQRKPNGQVGWQSYRMFEFFHGATSRYPSLFARVEPIFETPEQDYEGLDPSAKW